MPRYKRRRCYCTSSSIAPISTSVAIAAATEVDEGGSRACPKTAATVPESLSVLICRTSPSSGVRSL